MADIVDSIAVRFATEAVVMVAIDGEAGGFFVMKGTQSEHFAGLSFKFDIFTDQLRQIDFRKDAQFHVI